MPQYAIVIGMDYPGGEISKNRLFYGGNRRHMNRTAVAWSRRLADSVFYQLKADGIDLDRVELPVAVKVGGKFWDRNNAPDMHNLGELILDSIEAGTGINDRNFTFATTEAEYGVAIPEISVTITFNLKEKRRA